MRRVLQVSRVLKLPIPAKSTQLLGKEAVGEEGRGANLIDIGNGTVVVSAASLAWWQRPVHSATFAAQDCLFAGDPCAWMSLLAWCSQISHVLGA